MGGRGTEGIRNNTSREDEYDEEAANDNLRGDYERREREATSNSAPAVTSRQIASFRESFAKANTRQDLVRLKKKVQALYDRTGDIELQCLLSDIHREERDYT